MGLLGSCTTGAFCGALMALLDTAGNPIVTWRESDASNGDQIFVKRFDGSAWVAMGSGSDSGGGISATVTGDNDYPAIVMDAADNPIVAWIHNSSDVYVKRWDGSAWVEMGSGSASGTGLASDTTSSFSTKLRLDPAGDPVLVWGGSDIYALRFNGTAWVELAVGSATGLGITNAPMVASTPQVLIGEDGEITIIYDIGYSSTDVRALQFDGSTWTSALGDLTQTGEAEFPSAFLDHLGQSIVAFQDEEEGADDEIYVKRWNGSEWIDVGVVSSGGISANMGRSHQADIVRR